MPGEQCKPERRQKLGEADIAEVQWSVRERVHLPAHRNALHLKSERREQARRLEETKRRISERSARPRPLPLIAFSFEP
jgi:hypothetical protein